MGSVWRRGAFLFGGTGLERWSVIGMWFETFRSGWVLRHGIFELFSHRCLLMMGGFSPS